VAITLLDVSHKAVIIWNLADAIPINWRGPELKSDATTVAIQTLDLACGEITVKLG